LEVRAYARTLVVGQRAPYSFPAPLADIISVEYFLDIRERSYLRYIMYVATLTNIPFTHTTALSIPTGYGPREDLNILSNLHSSHTFLFS